VFIKRGILMYDFIYERMRRDIIKFYNNWYMGNIKCMRELHTILLDEYYTPGQFKGLRGEQLRTAKLEFLTCLQNTIDNLLECK